MPQPPRSPSPRSAFTLSLALLALLAVGAAGPRASRGDPLATLDATAVQRARALERELVSALRRVEPASVSIIGRQALRTRGRGNEPATYVVQGAASGVLVRWNGTWVLTNAHVVNNPGRLEAITSDGRTHGLAVHATDTSSDLAIAKLENTPVGLHPVRISAAGAAGPQSGTWVSSAGNPFMLALEGRSAAAMGVVSAMRSPRKGGYVQVTTVQHDAEVNPGNSGGPLWNLAGELLGINGSIATRSVTAGAGPSYTGASFAVPIDAIRAFLTKSLGPDTEPKPPATPVAGALRDIEAHYRHAIERVMPATVTCVPHDVRRRAAGFSSGVIVHPSGLVLSDGDAGLVYRRERVDGRMQRMRTWRSQIDVRIWSPSAKTWRTVPGRVLFRDRTVDTSLIQLTDVPAGGMPHFAPPGRSASVRPGDATLALGSAYGENSRSPPSLTAGVISSKDGGFIYTSAGVNPGVNGGPMVDLDGRLVGTVSTYVEAGENKPHGFLGKAVPIDGILDALRTVPEARKLIDSRRARRRTHAGGGALEAVVHGAGRRIRPSVVSIVVDRVAPVLATVPLEGHNIELRRYQGPVSGIAVGRGGLIVTSLYNLTNIAERVNPLWDVPEGGSITAGLAQIRALRVHLADGRSAEAEVVGHDIRWGFALLRAKTPLGGIAAPKVAPADALERGRFLITAGDPFGEKRHTDPLITMGILSKRHAETSAAPWRGMWQTDAGVLDGNVGGAAVDLEGRIVGMATLWDPAKHGRNSGIGFVVPWEAIQASISALLRGESPERGLVGIRFRGGPMPVIASVVSESGADRAGLRTGDRIRSVDGHATPTVIEALEIIGQRMRGERVEFVIERDGRRQQPTVTLGKRP